jgi:hypothetical protein
VGRIGRLLLSTACLAAIACGGIPVSNQLPEVTSEAEEGYHDLVFHLRDRTVSADGSQSFRARGLHKNQSVGLLVLLGPRWEQVSLGSDLPLAFRGSVELKSSGAESDALLAVMDKLYGTELHPTSMKRETTFTGITLGGDPRNVASSEVKIKLFFEPGNDEGYAELYLNIDMTGGRLQLNEKDEEYRRPIINALAESGHGG